MQELSLEEIIKNPVKRKIAVLNSLEWFFYVYFGHYIKYPPSHFHKEILSYLQDWEILFLEIIAFRGSAKSTLANLVLPIWGIITHQTKFPVLISDTFNQAKQHIYNLKTELENNKLLINDFGPFIQDERIKKEQWTATEMIIPAYNAKVIARSTGQKIRGIRYKQYRPDLFVVDDIENLEMVRKKEQRDKTYRWFLGDVLPAGDKNARCILIGNLLHSDSLMARVKKEIQNKEREGIVKEYPFWDKDKKPLWKEKFKTAEDIKKEKSKYDYRTWQREFLLKIVPEEGQVIYDDWIRYYDEIPNQQPVLAGTGVDLAISEKDTADYTAMVSGKLYYVDNEPKIYVLPYPVNEHLSFHKTIEKAREVSLRTGDNSLTQLFVEDVAYQKSAIQEMTRIGLPAKGVKVSTDKRARLETISSYIQNGTVLFPRKGCEDLIIQLTGFGIEAHDDLVDAFVYMVQGLMNQVANQPQLYIIG